MPSQAPLDYSATTSSFLSSTSNQVASGSVRRNLFSTHLSRRPAAAPAQDDGPSDSASEQSQQQYAPDPRQLPRAQGHRRSVSTPSLSPSPPRLSPYAHAQPHVFRPSPPPPMPQLSPTLRPAISDVYDPLISPNRPLTPRSSAALFPNQSILALNPMTGRPILPKIPVLPNKLRLTDSDEEEGEEGDDANDGSEDPAEGNADVERMDFDPSRSTAHEGFTSDEEDMPPHPILPRAPRRDYSDSPAWNPEWGRVPLHLPQQQPEHNTEAAIAAAAEEDDEAASDRRERERIERLLREMMARQRARAAATTKGKAVASSTRHRADEEEEAQEEKEELMGLIVGSLRREVARLDEEAWMFGEGGGTGGELVGRDDVAVYD